VRFAASPGYNVGMVGLAAARLAEKFHRPAVVVGICGDEARGSCRSVAGFDIIAALDRCSDLLIKHGGRRTGDVPSQRGISAVAPAGVRG
jgi:single-stranded-DNA-specific exonuclease